MTESTNYEFLNASFSPFPLSKYMLQTLPCLNPSMCMITQAHTCSVYIYIYVALHSHICTFKQKISGIWNWYNFKTTLKYRGADKSLTWPTFQCILFDGENISFDASLVIYINSTNIPPIMIIIRIYETQNLLSL